MPEGFFTQLARIEPVHTIISLNMNADILQTFLQNIGVLCVQQEVNSISRNGAGESKLAREASLILTDVKTAIPKSEVCVL